MKRSIGSKFFVLLALLYLYVPIVVLVVMGFNESRYNSLPFSFTLKWYQELAGDSALLIAARNSLLLALATGLVCMVLGTLFILGQRVLRERYKQLARSFVMMPMSIPWLILGLALLLLIRAVDLEKSLFFVLAGHIVISLPYTLLVLEARVQALDDTLEDMSASLGATGWTTFRRVTFPALAPAIVAGGFLAFMISFDNFSISYFLMPAGVSTLPIEIQSSIKFGFTPEINAISTVIIGVSLLCLAVVGLIMGKTFLGMMGGKKSMSEVSLKKLTKVYGGTTVVDHIDLTVPDGTLTSILGPSGCGKTTTLRMIAGFETPESGDVLFDGVSVSKVPVNQRGIGMVFQSYALFPHMTVGQNVSYGLEQQKVKGEELRQRVEEALKMVHMEEYINRKPRQLSGGQQQRVALARALVIRPRVLLLDECLSALDKKLRVEMQGELRRILEECGVTTFFVTHDQEEAMTLSDAIVVMNQGVIEQTGTPAEVYEHPRNRFVASFLGKANFFRGKDILSLVSQADPDTTYAVRPERITISTDGPGLRSVVESVVYAGSTTTCCVRWGEQAILAETRPEHGQATWKRGDEVVLSWAPDAAIPLED